jgi:hypothetical protein
MPREKKVQIPFHPLLSGLVPGFRPQLWRLYGIQKEGMEQGMGLERTFWKIGVCLFVWM